MAIVDEIHERLIGRLEGRTVADVRIGLGYVAVKLDGGRCGLAYSFREEAAEGGCTMREAGTLAGRPASELAAWVKHPDAVAAAVGLATLNALLDPPEDATKADLLDFLNIGGNDVVGMVGFFIPWVDTLRSRARALHIFERRPQYQPGVLPDWAAGMILPECDVVIISGATVVNRTLDSLLACCGKAREIAIAGPTTPLAPEVFRSRGVTLLGGVRVLDPDRVLRITGEGGGTRSFGKTIEKITVRLKP